MMTIELAVRRESLPENQDWRDDGCEVAPHCLQCPLVRCRYDEPGGLQRLKLADRAAQIMAAKARGQSVDQIAQAEGLSRRSVFRILRHEKRQDSE